MKKQIPNIITLLNLFCGCCALVNIFYGNFEIAIYLIMAAAGFDFFDGFAARLLKVSSPVGKELDSLADMVSFGVVPYTPDGQLYWPAHSSSDEIWSWYIDGLS